MVAHSNSLVTGLGSPSFVCSESGGLDIARKQKHARSGYQGCSGVHFIPNLEGPTFGITAMQPFLFQHGGAWVDTRVG